MFLALLLTLPLLSVPQAEDFNEDEAVEAAKQAIRDETGISEGRARDLPSVCRSMERQQLRMSSARDGLHASPYSRLSRVSQRDGRTLAAVRGTRHLY